MKIEEKLEKIENKELKYEKIRYWCQDETRIGLKTVTGKLLTGFGVKPVGKYQWTYKYLWLYGLIEPAFLR